VTGRPQNAASPPGRGAAQRQPSLLAQALGGSALQESVQLAGNGALAAAADLALALALGEAAAGGGPGRPMMDLAHHHDGVQGPGSAAGPHHDSGDGGQPGPDNPYDPNAVAVYIAGRKVGHLPRPAAQAFAPVDRRLAEQRQVGACSATITGGWDRGDGDTGHFGITLDLAHPDQLL
jgi:hypothetical protein